MEPIQNILNRIRWDEEFGRGEFEIGYYDRVEDSVIRVAFEDVLFPEEAHHLFQLLDAQGEIHRIPFHRVREVYKDGKLVWERFVQEE